MFGSDSVRESSCPDFHVLSVEVVPNLLVLMFIIYNVIFHHNDFIMSANEFLRNLSVINMNLTIHLHILILHSDQILIVFVSLDWDRAVVIKEQVEKWNVFCISVILETEWLFSDIEHHITEESEENFWRSELSSLFDLISDILDFYINILEASFSL